ncbi:MAG: undecaprenyl-diphosphate phosphatase, partial [Candidatus Aminicenantes bacterium]|nr:undecaprenyl-diphosphate phosphatase [Candidatus Aminicenantes bacterium]
GIFFNRWAKFFFVSVIFTSFMLLFTGILLWVGERKERPEGEKSLGKEDTGKGIGKMRATDALLIGIMQGVAIMPGISRSGATISTGLLRGIKKELAFRYSFLLSIPAIIGALGLQLREAFLEKNLPSHLLPWVGAALSAAVIGYLSLTLLRKAVIKKKLSVFAYYCWIVGTASLVIRVWGGL